MSWQGCVPRSAAHHRGAQSVSEPFRNLVGRPFPRSRAEAQHAEGARARTGIVRAGHWLESLPKMRVQGIGVAAAGALPLELVAEPLALRAAQLLGFRSRHACSKWLMG